MFAQLFGKYLIERGEITQEKWNEVLSKKSKARAKLGVIAVEDGLLTQEKADELNRLQMTRDKKFGDLAVEKGYLTVDQINNLLIRQGSPYMQLLQVIVENTDLSLAKVSTLVSEFQKELGFSISEMTDLKNDNIDEIVPLYARCDEKYVTQIVAITLRNLTRFISTDFYIKKLRKEEGFDYKALAFQKSESLQPPSSLMIGLAEVDDIDGFRKIAEGFMKKSAGDMSGKIVTDAAGEFVNITSGLFDMALVREDNIKLEIMPQEIRENGSISESVYVLPIFIEDKELDLVISVN